VTDTLESSDCAGRRGKHRPSLAVLELSDANYDRAGKIVGNLTAMWCDIPPSKTEKKSSRIFHSCPVSLFIVLTTSVGIMNKQDKG